MPIKKYLSEYVDDYLSGELLVARDFSDHSYISYATTLKQYLNFAAKKLAKKPSGLTVKDATFDQIRDFLIVSKDQRSWAQSTWNLKLAGVRAFINYLALVEPRYLELSRRVALIQCQRIPKSYVDYLTEVEILEALEFKARSFLQFRDQTLILFMFYTGVRVSEVTAMKLEDVDWAHSKMARLSISGKGRKARQIPLLDLKTIVNLQTLISFRTGRWSEYLFTTRDGGRMSNDNVRRIIKKYYAERFPERNISPHTLRHSAAMNMLERGVDLYSISSILGHEQIATTERYIRSRFEEKERHMKGAGLENSEQPLFKTQFSNNDNLIESLNMFISARRITGKK